MIEAAWAIFGILLLFSIFFLTAAVVFSRRMEKHSPPPDASLPTASILLSLKGSGTDLQDCLKSLLCQDYPDYDLRIVVHSQEDPAWQVVQSLPVTRGAKRVIIETLAEPPRACSGKCKGLLQLTDGLPPEVEVVALTDGDVVPSPSWLRELVTPLLNVSVGATFGIPWHTPPQGQWGSVTRWGWWGVSGVAMALHSWVWGGSMALRVSTLRESGIRKLWAKSLSSDTPMSNAVTSLNLRIVWVPAATVAIREETTLREFFRDVVRYLLVRRFYLPFWRRSRRVGDLLTTALFLGTGVVLLGMLTGSFHAAAIAAGSLVLYGVSFGLALLVADRSARRRLLFSGSSVPPSPIPVYVKLMASIPLVHTFFILGTVRAETTRSLEWRGIKYSVRDPGNVRVTSK